MQRNTKVAWLTMLVFIGFVLIGLSACTRRPVPDATKIPLSELSTPHTAAQIGPLELVVNEVQGKLIYVLQCTGPGTYTQAKVTASVTGSTHANTTPVPAVKCSAGDEVTRGELLDLKSLDTGEVISISLEVQPTDGSAQPIKRESVFSVGTNGKLYRPVGPG